MRLTALAKKEAGYQAKISAFGSLQGAISALQTAAAIANARAFEATGACIVMPHASFTADALLGHLMALIEGPERLTAMASAAHGAGRPDAAAKLADVVGEMISLPLSPSGVAA